MTVIVNGVQIRPAVPREKSAPGAALFERAQSKLYGVAAQPDAGTMDNVDNSYWQPRIRVAKANNDHFRAKRLAAERSEFFEMASEVGLSADQARRLSVMARDTDSRPIKRERLTDQEEQALAQKFGENVQQAVTKGYEILSNAIGTDPANLKRPALARAVAEGGAWAHLTVAEVAAELGAAALAGTSAEPKQ